MTVRNIEITLRRGSDIAGKGVSYTFGGADEVTRRLVAKALREVHVPGQSARALRQAFEERFRLEVTEDGEPVRTEAFVAELARIHAEPASEAEALYPTAAAMGEPGFAAERPAALGGAMLGAGLPAFRTALSDDLPPERGKGEP